MARNIRAVAELLGATVVDRLPETGGGAFGAARLAASVSRLRSRLKPGRGKRPGRPTDPNWVHHPKVPMSAETERRLARLAAELSAGSRKVSPMQLAAQILEDAIAQITGAAS